MVRAHSRAIESESSVSFPVASRSMQICVAGRADEYRDHTRLSGRSFCFNGRWMKIENTRAEDD
jgi:hypothetical protein